MLETTRSSIKMTEFHLMAARVRAARALLGWSQTDLAEAANVSRSTIQDLENARREPHPATLFVIESELTGAGVQFTDLGVEFRQYPPRPYKPTGRANRQEAGPK